MLCVAIQEICDFTQKGWPRGGFLWMHSIEWVWRQIDRSCSMYKWLLMLNFDKLDRFQSFGNVKDILYIPSAFWQTSLVHKSSRNVISLFKIHIRNSWTRDCSHGNAKMKQEQKNRARNSWFNLKSVTWILSWRDCKDVKEPNYLLRT